MYEPPTFPIVRPDAPQAPEPEGRLLVSLQSGELLLSMTYTDIHNAIGCLRLTRGIGGLSGWGAARDLVCALKEAQRRGCR